MDYEMKHIRVNGIELAYHDLGEGRPILFLHGALICAKTYRPAIESLSRHYRTIAPDVPGFGRSSMPAQVWDYQDYAEFFIGFMDHLGLAEISVMGHSFGGGIALAMGLRSQRIKHMILINAAGLPYQCTRTGFLGLLWKETIAGPIRYKQLNPLLCYIRDFMAYYLTRPWDAPRMIRILETCTQTACRFRETEVSPTLVVHGVNDQIFPECYAEQLHRQIGNSVFQRVSGGHAWPLYQGDQLGTLAKAFFSQDSLTT